MKKLISFILFSLTLNCFAHNQHTHQYITVEAFKLLKKVLQKEIPRMESSLGIFEGNIGTQPWAEGKITTGAWREDVEDVVFHYSNQNLPTFTELSGAIVSGASWIANIINENNNYYSSVTHFWKADRGDNLMTDLVVCPIYNTKCTIPNAYQKIAAYVNGNWEVLGNIDYLFDYNGKNARLVTMNGETIRQFYYSNLIDLFKTGIVNVRNLANAYYVLDAESGADRMYLPNNGTITLKLNTEVRTKIAWEILGRMCHLLQDMSVPSHSHADAHGTANLNENIEEYESYFGYDWNWDANKVYNTFGNIIDPSNYSSTNPIHFLMYTTSQVADCFGSNGPYEGDGNYSFLGNGLSEELTYLNNLKNSLETYNPIAPRIMIYNWNTDQKKAVRDYMFPYSIRATAGLLYWFAKEADLLPIPITGVTVSGTDILYQGATGVWGAAAQNGLEPFTYNWQIKYVDGGGYLQSFASVKAEKEKKDKDKKKDGDIIISLAPSNEWVPLYVNSDVLTRPHNPTDLRDYYLKCSVTDASGTTKTSNEWFVDVTADPPPVNPPQTNTLSADNLKSEMNVLSKETEIPKSYSLEQNYPNPFNPTTRISYSIAVSGFVTLKVFDILGREVATLVNEVKSAGRFEVEFNASELPTGTYIYKLTAGNYQTINKMLLLK